LPGLAEPGCGGTSSLARLLSRSCTRALRQELDKRLDKCFDKTFDKSLFSAKALKNKDL